MAGAKKSEARNFKKLMQQAGRWLLFSCAKLGLAVILGLVIYLIYLDNKVTRKFEGNKWQIPAQIFAKPQALYKGLELSMADLATLLDQLNYRQVDKLTGVGQYLVTHHHISIYRRSFESANDYYAKQQLIVEFAGNKIHRIVDRANNQLVTKTSLEPLLIERLLSPHQQDREFLPLESFPELFKDTLLLIEDRDFYHHKGVSLIGIARALWHNIKAGRTVQGGSTLTQQLAKNFYLNSERKLWRKINEAFIALILDYRYSKDQILEAYVNEVFLGQFHNRAIHGFGLASYYYFSKPIDELEAHEFAVLTAIIKGPSYYNPHRKQARLIERRDLVLRLMFEHHLLTKTEYQYAVNLPLGVSDKKQFLPLRFPAFIQQVKRELRKTIRNGQIVSDGIKVYTHLDPKIQLASEAVITQQLPLIEKQYGYEKIEAASVSVDIATGGIVAMVGGRKVNYSGLNRAVDMQRNIGSLIKPAIYLQALSLPQQYSLASRLQDKPITLLNRHGKQWSPKNFNQQHKGEMLLIDALAQSQNVPTVNLGMSLGFPLVTEGLKKLGVQTKIPQYPSLFLGALELSPLEVSQMYTTIADRGIYKPLTSIMAVIGAQGEVIYRHQHQAKAKFDFASVYLTQQAMIEVTRTGTAKTLKNQFPGVNLAGKTGTTDKNRDSWYSGFDNNTLTTLWLGKDDYSPVGLTATQGALRLYKGMYQQLPLQSIVDVMPSEVKLERCDGRKLAVIAKHGCK